MSNAAEFLEIVMSLSHEVSLKLVADPLIGPYVDQNHDIPRPFIGSEEIKLVIIGQDPTAGLAEERDQINTVLKLNKPGPLRNFVRTISERIGFDIDKNVYCTNLCKNFFNEKPSCMLEASSVDVISLAFPFWEPVLRRELENFPHAVIVTLGGPVLKRLVKPGVSDQMYDYWSPKGYSKVLADQSVLSREFFPFIHIRTLDRFYYLMNRFAYLDYIASDITGSSPHSAPSPTEPM